MSTNKNQPSLLSSFLDFFPLVIYLISFKYYKSHEIVLFGESYTEIVAATIISIPVLIVTMSVTYLLTKTITPIQIFIAVVIGFFGGLTIYFNNDAITKMRPTLVASFIAAVLSFGLYVRKKSYFQWLIGNYLQLREQDWFRFTRAYIILQLVMIIINEYVRRFMSNDAWVWFDTFGQIILGLIFFASQASVVKHAYDESLKKPHHDDQEKGSPK